MLSFAAENEARMEAMIAARSNVARKLDELVASFRVLRQEEITSEIIELSAGSMSAAGLVEVMRNAQSSAENLGRNGLQLSPDSSATSGIFVGPRLSFDQ